MIAFILFPILFLIILVAGTLARFFFGFGRKPFMGGHGQTGGRTYTYTTRPEQNQEKEPYAQQTQAKQEKIIPKNEGEYVDFEEVK